MSRRDTILIAVLINVGLLVILFATAVSGEKTAREAIVRAEPIAPPVILPAPVETPPDLAQRYVVGDEVDQVLAELQAEEPLVVETSAPAVEPPAPAVEQPNYVEVAVKKGDSLDKIARANESSVESIMEANSLSSTVLQIGQKLRVPLAKKGAIRRRRISSDTAKATTTNEADYYTIRSGDNPWSIAMKYRIPLDELLALNDLNENTARKLKPGDRIRVR